MQFEQCMLVAAVKQFYDTPDTGNLRVVKESFQAAFNVTTNKDEEAHMQSMRDKFDATVRT